MHDGLQYAEAVTFSDEAQMLARLEADLRAAQADHEAALRAVDAARARIQHIDGLLASLRSYFSGTVPLPHPSHSPGPAPAAAVSHANPAQIVEDFVMSRSGRLVGA